MATKSKNIMPPTMALPTLCLHSQNEIISLIINKQDWPISLIAEIAP